MGLWPNFVWEEEKVENLLQPLTNDTFSGSHCLDIMGANVNHSDPEWLVEMRNKEIKIMKGWITQYYDDLLALNETIKW